jgi:hypothetical protein
MKSSFQCFSNFYTFYHCILEEVGRLFIAMAKNSENYENFFNFSFDQLIDYGLSVFQLIDGHRSEKAFMIDCKYYQSNKKNV